MTLKQRLNGEKQCQMRRKGYVSANSILFWNASSHSCFRLLLSFVSFPQHNYKHMGWSSRLGMSICIGREGIWDTLRASLFGTFLQTLPEGALFISAQLSTDAVSALRKVWVLISLWKQTSTHVNTRHIQSG